MDIEDESDSYRDLHLRPEGIGQVSWNLGLDKSGQVTVGNGN
jgi:hypothetical protein